MRRHEREPLQAAAAVKADRVEEMVLDAVRTYSTMAAAPRRASRRGPEDIDKLREPAKRFGDS